MDSMDSTQYVTLEDFDQSSWKKFNAKTWNLNKPKFVSHLMQCWGRFPKVDQINAVFLEDEPKDDYHIEKYELNVSATGHTLDDFVQVWILKPHTPRANPCPTMVIHHQHAGQYGKGKEEPAGQKGDPQQAVAVDLVKRGYIVVTFDALGFSDRQEDGGERFTFTRLLLYGMTLNGKYCFDMARILDFLVTFKDIDKNRIGIMGHSLGGQMALFGGIFDSRFKVVISNCGFGRIGGFDSILSHHINHNFALYLPNLLNPTIGMDMHEVIGLLAPRPLLLSNGTMDLIFPIDGVAEIHQFIEDLYAAEGKSAHLLTLRHDSGHWIPPETKEKIYAFIDKML